MHRMYIMHTFDHMKILTKDQFRAIRERKRLSVIELAKEMGYSRDTIYKKENGINPITIMDVYVLTKIIGKRKKK